MSPHPRARPVCGRYTAGAGHCGSAIGVRRYLPGPRCPLHTPAVLAGLVPNPASAPTAYRPSAGAAAASAPDPHHLPAGEEHLMNTTTPNTTTTWARRWNDRRDHMAAQRRLKAALTDLHEVEDSADRAGRWAR